MPNDRIRTHELLELLELTVPLSSIRVSDVAIAVGWRDLVVFMRRGDGWVAVVVAPPATPGERRRVPVVEHEFEDFDGALDVLGSLWPQDDETTEAILHDAPDLGLRVDAWMGQVAMFFALRGEPPPQFRPHERSKWGQTMLDVVEVVTALFKVRKEDGDAS